MLLRSPLTFEPCACPAPSAILLPRRVATLAKREPGAHGERRVLSNAQRGGRWPPAASTRGAGMGSALFLARRSLHSLPVALPHHLRLSLLSQFNGVFLLAVALESMIRLSMNADSNFVDSNSILET
ncbi:unnamed protein product [Urochloa humidicola]